MMKLFSYFLGIVILFSCSTSSDVVSNKLFQKRKYQKGWHKNSSPNYASKTKKSKKNFSFSTTKDPVSSKEDKIADNSIKSVEGTKKESVKIEVTKKEFKNVSVQSKSSKTVEVETPIDKIRKEAKNLTFDKQDTPLSKDRVNSPPLDRNDSDTRVLLAILGLLVLLFTGISPLAVWIALGRGEALRINSILFLVSMLFAILLLVAIVASLAVGSDILAVVLGVLTIALFIATYIHAIVSIIRGY